MKRPAMWLIASVFGFLLVGVGVSYLQQQRAMEQAARARDQAGEVQRLAAQVAALTDRPAIALTPREDVRQISGLIEETAIACGIDKARLKRIDAQAARRVGKTPYDRLPTRVTIEGVEMPQLVDLLARLTDGDRLRIEDCRFSAPHDEVVGKSWNAEFTLAYLVYNAEQDQTRQ